MNYKLIKNELGINYEWTKNELWIMNELDSLYVKVVSMTLVLHKRSSILSSPCLDGPSFNIPCTNFFA